MTRAARVPYDEIGRTLDRVRHACDVEARRAADPVGVVHGYEGPLDQEIAALVAACIAFGNVKTIRGKLGELLHALGPHPSTAAEDEARVHRALSRWKHRVFRGEDVACLVVGARRVQRTNGSLGARFAADLAETRDLREALSRFCAAIRDAGGLGRGKTKRRGPAHLLPEPRGTGGSKRLLLFLRWMIRPADGVDLGLWDVPTSALLCPVDTHIHKLARNLGLTTRKGVTWETAEEITAGLRRLDPVDPVKYDFSLCHMGMLQRCPSRRDPARCDGCGVKPVCRHWTKAAVRASLTTQK